MFGSSLFALQAGKGRSRFWSILPLSILLHLVAFVGFVGAQYWTVAAVAEPELAAVFVVSLPPPAAAPAGHSQPTKPTVKPAVERQVPVVRQPEPQDHPTPAPLPPAGGPASDDPVSPNSGPGTPGGTDPNSNYTGPAGDGPSTPVVVAEPVVKEGPLPLGGAIVKPEIIAGTRIKPSYTEGARRAHLQGVVMLEAIIDTEGNVTGVRIVKPLPLGLDQEAVRAVRQWRFRPATLHGRPVSVFFQLAVTFEVAS